MITSFFLFSILTYVLVVVYNGKRYKQKMMLHYYIDKAGRVGLG